MSEIVRHGGGASALQIRPEQTDWTPEQANALLEMFNLGNAPHAVIRSYFHVAQSTGLDPFKRQIHLIERQGKYTPQTSIDGFRMIRDRSGVFDGGEIAWCGPDGVWRDVWLESGFPAAARYTLHRTDQNLPVVATALWDAYVQTRGKDGAVTHMWAKMGPHMLAKVAEALAIRMAFPDDTGGLYTDDEMAQATAPALEPGESFSERRQTQRERSPGIMDLEEPPVSTSTARRPDQAVGGGFMDAPPAAPAEDPNIVDAEEVTDEPEAHVAAAPAPVPAPEAPQPAESVPGPESVDYAAVQEAEAAPMDMNPQPDPGPNLTWPWATRLVEVLEDPQFDVYKLRVVYDDAAADGALGSRVPWAGRSFDETVQAIRVNLDAGRDPVEGISERAAQQ